MVHDICSRRHRRVPALFPLHYATAVQKYVAEVVEQGFPSEQASGVHPVYVINIR